MHTSDSEPLSGPIPGTDTSRDDGGVASDLADAFESAIDGGETPENPESREHGHHGCHGYGGPHHHWKDLSSAQRAGIVVLSAAQLALAGAAAVDLVRRPAAQVRGPKALWGLGLAVNWFGPAAYLLLGRRR